MKPDDFANLPSLLTIRQAAYILNVSLTTINRLKKSHALRSVKIDKLVRFEADALKEFIARRRSRRVPFDVSHLQDSK